MWPFSTKQERQAEAMSQILAENSYERKLERIAGWVRTVVALVGGVLITFFGLIALEQMGEIHPSDVWAWLQTLW